MSHYRDATGRNVLPAVAPELARVVVDHLLDVLADSVRAVDPCDGDVLDKYGDHDRVDGRVVVQELDDVVAALGATRQANKEVERE